MRPSSTFRTSGPNNVSPALGVQPSSTSTSINKNNTVRNNNNNIASSFSDDVDMAIKLRELQTLIFESHLEMETGSAKLDPVYDFDNDFSNDFLSFPVQHEKVNKLSGKINDLMDLLAASTSHYREQELQREVENKYLNEGLRLNPNIVPLNNNGNYTTSVPSSSNFSKGSSSNNNNNLSSSSSIPPSNQQTIGSTNDYSVSRMNPGSNNSNLPQTYNYYNASRK